MRIERVGDVRCQVGEGPLWDHEAQRLYFVDIRGRRLHRHDPATDAMTAWDLPLQIGCLAIRRGGGAILALEDGFYAFDFETGDARPFARPEGDDTQFNDGKVDRQGRFVAGTASGFSNPVPGASLYRLDPDRTVHKIASGLSITNGPAWSPDGRTFYVADSKLGTVFAYDYDIGTGEASGRREFFALGDLGDGPDGGTVDADGCYWTTIVMGGKIACVRPDGRLERLVDVPVPWPSSLMFGGPKLDRLYVTSIDGAVYGRPSTPDSGGLFVIDGLGAKGLAEARYQG